MKKHLKLWIKRAAKPLVVYAVAHPEIKGRVLYWVGKYPKLKGILRPFVSYAMKERSVGALPLTPAARRIYDELKIAINAQAKGER